MSTEGPATIQPDSLGSDSIEKDVLDLGSTASDQRRRRSLVLIIVLVGLLVAGIVVWRAWPSTPGPMTREELQGVYAGMVRSDGTNDAEQIHTDVDPTSAARISPAACAPLFQVAQTGLVPGARDGMTTYWSEGDTTAMTTYRFDDRRGADELVTSISAALAECSGRKLGTPSEARGPGFSGTVTRADVETPIDGTRQVGYLVTSEEFRVPSDPAPRFTLRVLSFNNTVSVLFRYDTSGQPYDSIKEDRLAASLVAQMKAVQDLRKGPGR